MSAERIPIANVYYLLCYAWRDVEERDRVRMDGLDELDRVRNPLGTVLAWGTFRLTRQGIDRGHREVREYLAGIRGKVDVGRTAKRAGVRRAHGKLDGVTVGHGSPQSAVLFFQMGPAWNVTPPRTGHHGHGTGDRRSTEPDRSWDARLSVGRTAEPRRRSALLARHCRSRQRGELSTLACRFRLSASRRFPGFGGPGRGI